MYILYIYMKLESIYVNIYIYKVGNKLLLLKLNC